MQTNNKMAVAPVGKLIWQMSIPPLISMFLQYSYNLIDSAFVARLSENALTAVSLSFPITTLMNATSIWIGVGVNVLIAGYLGEKKQETESSYTYLWVLIYLKLTIICDCTIGDIERNLHKICSMRSSALKIMLCLLLSFTVFRIEASPNIYSISGRISDERAGSPLPGASILIKGTYLWAISDQKGEFTIQGVQEGKYNLEVSFLGYVPATIPVNVRSNINNLPIILKENTLALDDVCLLYTSDAADD